jgi:AraC-like DNA-binding protein
MICRIVTPGPADRIYSVAGIATIVQSLESEGIAPGEALADADLSAPQLRSPATRVSLHQILCCYANAARLSHDPYFAYRTGLRFHVSTFGIYGYAILSGTDCRETSRLAEKMYQVQAPEADIAFREEDDRVTWVIYPRPLPAVDATLYRFIVELHFGIGVSLYRDIMGPAVAPQILRVTYPDDDRPSAAQVFGCPVAFGEAKNSWSLDKRWLGGPARLAHPLAHFEAVELCKMLIGEMHLKVGVAGKVREALLGNLAKPKGFDAIARQLGTPIRTLKRKLREEGTTYRQIVDELRMQLAIKYLRDTRLPVEDVASSLGFSDAANFRRAFRRWTNESPGHLRNGNGSRGS